MLHQTAGCVLSPRVRAGPTERSRAAGDAARSTLFERVFGFCDSSALATHPIVFWRSLCFVRSTRPHVRAAPLALLAHRRARGPGWGGGGGGGGAWRGVSRAVPRAIWVRRSQAADGAAVLGPRPAWPRRSDWHEPALQPRRGAEAAVARQRRVSELTDVDAALFDMASTTIRESIGRRTVGLPRDDDDEFAVNSPHWQAPASTVGRPSDRRLLRGVLRRPFGRWGWGFCASRMCAHFVCVCSGGDVRERTPRKVMGAPPLPRAGSAMPHHAGRKGLLGLLACSLGPRSALSKPRQCIFVAWLPQHTTSEVAHKAAFEEKRTWVDPQLRP